MEGRRKDQTTFEPGNLHRQKLLFLRQFSENQIGLLIINDGQKEVMFKFSGGILLEHF